MAPFKKSFSSVWPLLVALAVGVAAFLWPIADEAGGRSCQSNRSVRPAVLRAESDAAAVFQKALDDAAAAKQAEREELSKLDGATRRAEILKLSRQREQETDFQAMLAGRYRRLSDLRDDLVDQEGLEGIKWLEEHMPDSVGDELNHWAEQDPAAVFDYLAKTDRSGAYSYDLLETALTGHVSAASGDPAALLDGVQRLPWHLVKEFKGGADDESMSFEPSPNDIPAKLWVESGAAEYLERQGLEVKGLAGNLIAEDQPALAVALWQARAAHDPEWSDRQVMNLFDNLVEVKEQGLRQALLDAGPAAEELFFASVKRLKLANRDDPYNHINANWEILLPEESEAPPPQESDAAPAPKDEDGEGSQ